jgi:hypothetical protein
MSMKLIAPGVGLISLLVINGCGSSGSQDPALPPVTPPTAATTNAPYRLNASNDLTIFMCHVHQDYYADPVHFAFWWDVRSSFTTAVPSIAWKIERLDGTPPPAVTGTITNLPANNAGVDGHEVFVPWIESDRGSHHRYKLTINSDRAIVESNYDNDSFIFEVDVPNLETPSQAGDLEFNSDSAHVHMWMPDSENEIHFDVRNRLASAVPATKWRLRDALEGIDASYDLDAISAGGVVVGNQLIQLLTPGLHAVTITIDSLNAVGETNEANNVSTQYILVGPPVGIAAGRPDSAWPRRDLQLALRAEPQRGVRCTAVAHPGLGSGGSCKMHCPESMGVLRVSR